MICSIGKNKKKKNNAQDLMNKGCEDQEGERKKKVEGGVRILYFPL